jgi:flagellar hook-length control protein FliK
MSTSILKILPNAAPAASPPAASRSSGQAQDSGFSQQLSRAKSKPSQSAPAPSQPSNDAAGSAAKKTQTKSVQLKDKSNPQQKQQNADADSSDAAQTEAQPQTQAQISESIPDEQPDVADAAPSTPAPVPAKLTNVLSLQAANPATGNPDAKPVAGKPAAQKTDQPAPASQTSPDLTTLATAASAQQSPDAAAAAKTATAGGSASSDDSADDAATLKQTTTRPNVSPFKPADSPADDSAADGNASGADGQASADVQLTAAADAGAQLPGKDKAADADSTASTFAQLLPGFSAADAAANHAQPTAVAQSSVAQSPVAQFAEANQPSIVSTIHGSLLPNGGTMNITLNPPDLGAMQITVRMESGVMSASFQTSNDQATRLLTHTLGQLKDALETQGVSVGRLHVQQSSNSENPSGKGNDSESGGQQSSDGRSAQQEQQRRETLRRMWRRIRGDNDPLDLVA